MEDERLVEEVDWEKEEEERLVEAKEMVGKWLDRVGWDGRQLVLGKELAGGRRFLYPYFA